MSDAIEQYLMSPRAADDVNDLLMLSARWVYNRGDFGWRRHPERAWTLVAARDLLPAYFRESDGRYLVTDCGGGLNSYMAETGDVELPALPDLSAGVLLRDGRVFACSRRGDSLLLTVERAELPVAIVRVLLTTYRIATTEARRDA